MSIWQPVGSWQQNGIVEAALARTTFPFDVLLPGLQASVNRSTIPVEWADLSKHNALLTQSAHPHVHEFGDTAHPVTARNQVLGLAWYSGKVTLDFSLEPDPQLAGEVFLSEGAHMIDFFWMTDTHRTIIWNALHPPEQQIDPATDVEDAVDLGHGHGWFDVDDYYTWLGEAWMGLFVRAYSDFPVTIPFDHPPTDEAVEYVRSAFEPYLPIERA